MVQADVPPEALSAEIRVVERKEKDLEVVVRIANSADRALHYIADVRAVRYDPASNTLTLAMSDEGRQVIPMMVGALPKFQFVDPGSQAELRLKIPDRLISCRAAHRPASLVLKSTTFQRCVIWWSRSPGRGCLLQRYPGGAGAARRDAFAGSALGTA